MKAFPNDETAGRTGEWPGPGWLARLMCRWLMHGGRLDNRLSELDASLKFNEERMIPPPRRRDRGMQIAPVGRRFRNRKDAGQLLAGALKRYAGRDDVIVLGLPEGGLPVAWEVANRLNAPLDVFVVRKLGLPGFGGLSMGVIATGGVRVLNHDMVECLGLSERVINDLTATGLRELDRCERDFRGRESPPRIHDRIVIIVDDGAGANSTLLEAVRALCAMNPARIIAAVPVASRALCSKLEREADEVVALICPEEPDPAARWYLTFPQTTEREVAEILSAAGHGRNRILQSAS